METIGLIHISDTHFSSRILSRSFGPNVGWHPHHLDLCRGLPLGIRDARRQLGVAARERLRFILSGDMTAGGGEAEFAVGHSYLFFSNK